MKIKIVFLSILLLAACNNRQSEQQKGLPEDWPKGWYYSIVDPYMFPAKPKVVRYVTIDGSVYINRRVLKGTGGLSLASQGKWGESTIASRSNNDPIPSLPQVFGVCWFSVVEQKTYESIITIPSYGRDLMLEKIIIRMPNGSDSDYYRNTVYFGLAPGGAIKAWLRNPGVKGRNVVIAEGSSLSGAAMRWCQEIEGNGMSDRTKEYIKDKVFPYGEW